MQQGGGMLDLTVGAYDRGLAETLDNRTVAAEHGLKASLCSQESLLAPGLQAARCVDAERLSRVAGRAIAARTKGNRPGCLCAESRDIGAYDSCPHGCVYCYAVRSPDLAKRNHRRHDPAAESLLGTPAPANTAEAIRSR